MKLYFAPGACSMAPHIALREAGVPVDLVKVDTKNKTYEGGDYRQINGKGYVPTIELDDKTRVTEVAVILQYIADSAPQTRLAPASGTMERVRLQEWLNFISSEIHKQFSPLFDATASDEIKIRQRDKLAGRFDWLVQQLAGKDFLTGSNFTIADAYLFTVLNWGQWTNVDLGKWPLLSQYMARVAARPKVQEAMKAEKLIK